MNLKNQDNKSATKKDLLILESRIESKLGEIRGDINIMKDDINIMKDDVAKVLTFLYEHFPIQQHQVRENTDRIEGHEVRIVRLEDVIDISSIR